MNLWLKTRQSSGRSLASLGDPEIGPHEFAGEVFGGVDAPTAKHEPVVARLVHTRGPLVERRGL